MITLEVSKFYKSRSGLKIGPMERYDSDHFECSSMDHPYNGFVWLGDGRRWNEFDTSNRLVSEWVEVEEDVVETTKKETKMGLKETVEVFTKEALALRDLAIKAHPHSKINQIKGVRQVTGAGLKESKELVEFEG